MIADLQVLRPRVITDELGSVRRILRIDDPHFCGFGEVYFSTLNPGAVKAWKRHREMIMTLTVASGHVLFVFYDDRVDSASAENIQEVEVTPNTHLVMSVPPMVWTGFKCLGDAPAVLVNCASIAHKPEEADRLDYDNAIIPYNWITQKRRTALA